MLELVDEGLCQLCNSSNLQPYALVRSVRFHSNTSVEESNTSTILSSFLLGVRNPIEVYTTVLSVCSKKVKKYEMCLLSWQLHCGNKGKQLF